MCSGRSPPRRRTFAARAVHVKIGNTTMPPPAPALPNQTVIYRTLALSYSLSLLLCSDLLAVAAVFLFFFGKENFALKLSYHVELFLFFVFCLIKLLLLARAHFLVLLRRGLEGSWGLGCKNYLQQTPVLRWLSDPGKGDNCVGYNGVACRSLAFLTLRGVFKSDFR